MLQLIYHGGLKEAEAAPIADILQHIFRDRLGDVMQFASNDNLRLTRRDWPMFALPRQQGRFVDISDGKYTLTDRGAAHMADIKAMIDAEADRILPDYIKRRFDREVIYGPRPPDGWNDPYEMIVAVALNSEFRRKGGAMSVIRHESAEVLERLGFLTKDEMAVLHADAEFLRVRQAENIDARYMPLYAERFADNPLGLEAALRSETVWAMLENYERGVRFHPRINAIIDPIVRFFLRIRNWLAGRGFESGRDVFDRILSGEVARREADIAVWMDALGANVPREQVRAQVIEAHSGPMFAARRDIDNSVDQRARELFADIRNFEKSLREAEKTPDEIAAAIKERYGFDVRPEDIEAGSVWWRVDEVPDDLRSAFTYEHRPHDQQAMRQAEIADENIPAPRDIDARPATPQTLTPPAAHEPGPRHVGAALTPELREEIVRLYDGGRGLSSAKISTTLSQRLGQYIGAGDVAVVLEVAGMFKRGFGNERVELPEAAVSKLLDPDLGRRSLRQQAEDLAAMMAEWEGMRKIRDQDAFIAHQRYKLRREGRVVPDIPGSGRPPTVGRPSHALATQRILDPEFAGLPIKQQVEELSAAPYNLDITPQALRQRRHVLRERGADVPAAPGTRARFTFTDDAVDRLNSAELAHLTDEQKARAIDPSGTLTAEGIRSWRKRMRATGREDLAPETAERRTRRSGYPPEVREWLASSEAYEMTQGQAAAAIKERFGVDATPDQVGAARYHARRKAALAEPNDDGARTADLATKASVCKS
jgi:hypothetical protein